MYLSSLVVMAAVVAASGAPAPGGEAILAAMLAGAAGICALSAFYRALAIGTMSIVAPIASTGVALPVVVGLATGDDPSAAGAVGIVAAVVGVVMASREEDGTVLDARRRRVSILLALAAGPGLRVLLRGRGDRLARERPWALLLSRVAAGPAVLPWPACCCAAAPCGPARATSRSSFGVGLIDLGANALYNQATTIGELSSVSVASSLYPVGTVLLAAAFLGERVRGTQRAGVVITLCGVVLIAAGSA